MGLWAYFDKLMTESLIYSPVCDADIPFRSGFSISYLVLLLMLCLQMVSLVWGDGNTHAQLLCSDVIRLFKIKVSPSQAWKMIWIETMDPDACELQLSKWDVQGVRSKEPEAKPITAYREATGNCNGSICISGEPLPFLLETVLKDQSTKNYNWFC